MLLKITFARAHKKLTPLKCHSTLNMDNSTACIFCGTAPGKPFWEENGFTGIKCQNCGLIYISPPPRQDEVESIYRYDHADTSAREHIAGEYMKRLEARFKIGLIKRICANGKLLEIGSGAGFFLDEAKRAGYDIIGIEPNPALAEHISKIHKINIVSGTLQRDTFSPGSFDIVYHCDVLSHLPDPIEQFRIMASLLKDNRMMVFETGNFGHIAKYWLKFVGKLQYPDHLFLYSKKSIVNLCKESGFEIVFRKSYGIAAQLILLRLVKLIYRGNRNHQGIGDAPVKDESTFVIEPGIFRKLYCGLSLFLRYRLGSIIRFGPGTVVYFARKRG